MKIDFFSLQYFSEGKGLTIRKPQSWKFKDGGVTHSGESQGAKRSGGQGARRAAAPAQAGMSGSPAQGGLEGQGGREAVAVGGARTEPPRAG